MSNVSILIAAIILCVTVECQCSEEPEIKPLNTVNPITKSSRLLFVPAPSYSHLNVLKIIATDLCQSSEYHHQCTFAVFDEQLDSFRSATNIFKVITFGKIPLPPKVDGSKIKTTLQFHSHITLPFFSNLYKPMHHALMNHLKTNTYDLLIINMFAFAAQDIAYDLKIPYVILAYTTVEGNLILPSWIPRGYDFMTPTDLTMSIIRRFYNKFIVPIQMLYYLWPHMQRLDRIRIECNRSTHGSFSTPIIQRWNGHPVLLPYSRAFDFKRPLSMNYHYVGFVTGESQADASKSEDDKSVQFWLNKNSEDKEEKEVIMYVGLGSLTKLSQSEWISIVNSLAFLPKLRLLLSVSDLSSYNFLLNYTQTIAVSPHRILLRQWLNQNLVLQHSRVKFFVNHGGINSIGEGVYACKPMLVMPGFADQQANAAKALELQIGLILHRDKLSSETLVEKLKELIAKEELMKEKLFKLHQISELEGGAKMTAKLINHWLLIGYKHVDTTENYLSVVIYYELDMIATFGLIAVVVLVVVIKIIKKLFSAKRVMSSGDKIQKKKL